MKDKVILYGETHTEITDLLANNVRIANEQNKAKAQRIYLNWIEFINSLKSVGLCGLQPEYVSDFKEHESVENKSLDSVIKSCEEISKNNEVKSSCNEYYKTSDGFFDYFVNRKTGEKKFKLDENDVEVESNLDDFWRGL